MTQQKQGGASEVSLPSMTRAFLFLLLLTPLLYWPYLFFYYSNPKVYFFLAVTEIAFLCFVWCVVRHREWRPRLNLLSLLVLSYVGLYLFTGLIGENPSYSFWGSIDRSTSGLVLLHLGAVFLMLIAMVPSQKKWREIFTISVNVALVVTAIFFLSKLFPEATPLFAKSKGGSMFGNSSFFGTYLLFQIGFSLYLACTYSTKRERLFSVGASVILIFALLITSAQAAKLAFFGGGVLFPILFLISDQAKRWKKRTGIVLLGTLTVTFVIFWSLLLQPGNQVREWVVLRSSETRFILWDMAWQGVVDRPMFGWGPENFRDVFQTYYNPCLGSPACGGEIWFDRAHNKLLDVWVESGIIGLGLYLSLFVVALVNLWRAMRKGILSRCSFALFSSLLLAYFVQNLTVFDTLVSSLLFILVLAFFTIVDTPSDAAKRIEEKKSTPWLTSTAILVTIAIPFTFFWFVIQPLRGNIATADVVHASLLSERLLAYEKAVTISRQGIDLRRSMLAAQTATFILDLGEEQIVKSSTLLQQELQFSEEALLQTIEQSPLFLRAYLDLAFIYQVWDRRFDANKMKQAEFILESAIARFPNNPLPYWSLVGISLGQGKNEEALQIAEKALALDPHVRMSQLRYLLTLKMSGLIDQMDKVVETFAFLDSTIVETITPFFEANLDDETQVESLLFRYYYDAAFK